MAWNYLKLIILVSICVKIWIYCIIIPKVENRLLKNNPPKKCTCLCAVVTKPLLMVQCATHLHMLISYAMLCSLLLEFILKVWVFKVWGFRVCYKQMTRHTLWPIFSWKKDLWNLSRFWNLAVVQCVVLLKGCATHLHFVDLICNVL